MITMYLNKIFIIIYLPDAYDGIFRQNDLLKFITMVYIDCRICLEKIAMKIPCFTQGKRDKTLHALRITAPCTEIVLQIFNVTYQYIPFIRDERQEAAPRLRSASAFSTGSHYAVYSIGKKDCLISCSSATGYITAELVRSESHPARSAHYAFPEKRCFVYISI